MKFIRNMFKQYWSIDDVKEQIKNSEYSIDYDTDILIKFSVRYTFTNNLTQNLLEQYKQRVRLQYIFVVLNRGETK